MISFVLPFCRSFSFTTKQFRTFPTFKVRFCPCSTCSPCTLRTFLFSFDPCVCDVRFFSLTFVLRRTLHLYQHFPSMLMIATASASVNCVVLMFGVPCRKWLKGPERSIHFVSKKTNIYKQVCLNICLLWQIVKADRRPLIVAEGKKKITSLIISDVIFVSVDARKLFNFRQISRLDLNYRKTTLGTSTTFNLISFADQTFFAKGFVALIAVCLLNPKCLCVFTCECTCRWIGFLRSNVTTVWLHTHTHTHTRCLIE